MKTATVNCCMSDLWHSLKGAFVEDVPDSPKPGVPEKELKRAQDSSAGPAPTAGPVLRSTNRPSIPFRSSVDQAARQRLEQIIESSAPPGYKEVQDNISALAESIPDEGGRIRASLKLALKHGHTVDDILSDFDKCIGILEQQERDFQVESKKQIAKTVGNRQTLVTNLDSQIEQKKQQILSLQGEISALSEQRNTESAAISTDSARIKAISDSFESTYDVVMDQLTERRKAIEIYGKAG